jgi:hypothetical protein
MARPDLVPTQNREDVYRARYYRNQGTIYRKYGLLVAL